jgi:hypothetical protein
MLEIESKYRSISFRELVSEIPSTTHATFGLYRYPAKFIPQVIAYILKNYAKSSSKVKVFDPFAGYGTVGVVARIYNCDYELWDLNPILEVLHAVATQTLRNANITSLLQQMDSCNEEFIPQWSKLQYWYPKEFLPFLFKVWGFYHSLGDEYAKNLLIIPLLKVTRYFSYDDIQRQKLSKSPKSKQRIKSLLDSNWKVEFFRLLGDEIKNVVEGIRKYQKYSPKDVRGIVKGGVDTFSMKLKEEKNMLITSPPYLQSHEYIRQAKMDLFWLGFSEGDVGKLSKLEIPYRDVPPQHIYSETYLKWENQIEEPPLRKIFNNYFWGVLGALTRLQTKITSYMFLFVGRASMRGQPVPIDQIFAEHFSSLGWTHEATLMDKIVARRLFSYKVNPATNIVDNRTPTENLVILKKS